MPGAIDSYLPDIIAVFFSAIMIEDGTFCIIKGRMSNRSNNPFGEDRTERVRGVRRIRKAKVGIQNRPPIPKKNSPPIGYPTSPPDPQSKQLQTGRFYPV